MPTIEIEGEEILDSKAKEFGSGAHVTVPKKWRGANVKVVRLDEPLNPENLSIDDIDKQHIDEHDPEAELADGKCEYILIKTQKCWKERFLHFIDELDEAESDTKGVSVVDVAYHMYNHTNFEIEVIRKVIRTMVEMGEINHHGEDRISTVGDSHRLDENMTNDGGESEEINVNEVFLKSETDDSDADTGDSMPVTPENENVWRDESPAENQTHPPEDNPSIGEIEVYHINTHKRTVEAEFENIFSESKRASESMKTLIQRIDDADPDSKGAPLLDVYSYAYYEYGFDIDEIQRVMDEILCSGDIYTPDDHRVVVLD